jgi:nucleotide-binding universal stress UspA family protein
VVPVRRYLVVANQTLGGEPLLATIRRLNRPGPSAFHLVAPITPPRDHVWTEGEARAVAAERLEAAVERLTALGIEADGEVGDESPMLAIEDAMRDDGPYDAIVVSTLPRGLSRWLRIDLPHRVESAFGLEVIHVVGERDSGRTRRAG